jgi:hypothetical protein
MNVPKRWLTALLTGVLVGFLALALMGGQALAQEPITPSGSNLSADLGFMQVQMGSDHFRLDWNVIGSGGGDMTSTHFQMSNTIGQPTVGAKSSDHYDLCDGFWCAVGHFIQGLFLPLIQQNN